MTAYLFDRVKLPLPEQDSLKCSPGLTYCHLAWLAAHNLAVLYLLLMTLEQITEIEGCKLFMFHSKNDTNSEDTIYIAAHKWHEWEDWNLGNIR